VLCLLWFYYSFLLLKNNYLLLVINLLLRTHLLNIEKFFRINYVGLVLHIWLIRVIHTIPCKCLVTEVFIIFIINLSFHHLLVHPISLHLLSHHCALDTANSLLLQKSPLLSKHATRLIYTSLISNNLFLSFTCLWSWYLRQFFITINNSIL